MMSSLSSPEVVQSYLSFTQRSTSELNVVSIDHNYAKPWSTHPEASNARATRLLFMDLMPRQAYTENEDVNDDIDVVGQGKLTMPEYDVSNARSMMSECERHASLLRPDFTETNDWEDHIAAIRTTWSVLQNRIFAKVMRVLQSDCLSRLTIKETKNEPIQRRLQIDKAAKRVRFAFANANWDKPLILWLHNLFLENLRGNLLTSYLEILQTLKLKVPSLIESLIEGTVCKPGSLTMDSLNVLLKRTWDPVLSSINHQKPKKLPGQSLLLVISNVPFMAAGHLATKRHKFWQHQLNFMGKVFNVIPVNTSTATSVANCVENMVASTRSKILEVKSHFPGRPIVLVGFHIGSLVACQVALMEQVQAVVCLGYPTMGVSGNRVEIDDPVYGYKTPTLFVVGQYASSCSVDDLEDIREKLRVDSGMVVVGGSDDHLRMCRSRKKSCGVTQCVVDRCIIDEMTNFLGNILQLELSFSDSIDDVDIVKKSPRKRKQKQALAVAVGSQTPGDLIKQKSAKALKSLKQDPMLSSVGARLESNNLLSSVTSPSSPSVPKLAKISKKSPSKKRLSKSSDPETSVKRPLMHVNFKSGPSKKSQGQSSLSNRNEAAVIASAPELSNLLQNMKSDIARFSSAQTASSSPLISSLSSTPPTFIPSSIPTTTAFTLSKFLLSSDIFQSGENLLVDPADITFESKLDRSEKSSAMASSSPSAVLAGADILKKRETQILIHTKDSAVPVSFPVKFTMANKVLKTNTPLVRVGAGSQAIPTFTYESNKSILQPQAKANTLQVLQSTSNFLSTDLQTSIPSSKVPTSSVKASLASSKSPISSVLDIGSDTVEMKETPPSTTAPGTVSIDLGQLSTSNNIVMKFGNSSKISLMPTLKPVSSSSLLSADKRDVTVASLLGDLKNPICSNLPVTTMAKSQSASIPIYTPGKAPEKNLTILSGTNLLSTLSSNTGLITLKLSSPPTSAGLSLPTPKASEKNEASEGIIKGSSGGVAPKNVTAMTFNPTTITGFSGKLTKPLLSQYLLKDQKEDKSDPKLTSTVPVIFATMTKPSATSTVPSSSSSSGQLLFQPSSIPGKVSSIRNVLDCPETLGKVSSLLESSPVTVDQPKSTTVLATDSCSSKDSTPDNSAFKAGTKSQAATSSLSQSQTSTPRASKMTIASYTPTTKPVLPTVASTRTRRIKTPKQYDL